MKKGWQTKRLGDLSDLITKGTTPTSVGYAFALEGINFVKVESISGNGQFIESKLAKITQECHNALRRSQLESGDILFSIAGALGRTAFVTDNVIPANTNQALAIIRLKKSNDVLPEFVLKALDAGIVLEQIEKFKGGVAQQNLSLTQVQGFQIPVPPLPEQRRIVGILDKAFAGIAIAKANAEKNLQNARALFESHLNTVFTRRGEGWMERPMGEVCMVKDGTHDSPTYVADGIPFVTQKNIREEGLSFDKTKFIRQEDHDNFYRRSNAAQGDILISMIGANRGMACIVDDERIFSIKNVGLVKQNPSINQQFLLYFLKSPQAAGYVHGASKGGAQEFVGLTELRRFPVPFPSLERQNTLAEKFQSLRKETQRIESIYQQKLAALEALKKSLLHQAFNGEL